MTKFSAFLKDEAGAVTVDWVVLTAAIVGLGLLVFSFVPFGTAAGMQFWFLEGALHGAMAHRPRLR